MRLLRRTTAFVLSLLLVQLWLVAGDPSCALQAAGAAEVRHAERHAGMAMDSSGSSMTGAAGHDMESESHHGFPAAPRTPGNCTMPVACATPSLPATAVTALEAAPLDSQGWTDPALLHAAPLRAPELPPPRA